MSRTQKEIEQFKDSFKKKIYDWVIRLIKLIDDLPKGSASNSVIGKQLLRSGTSVLANYIEAKSASSKKDFTNFFNHSLKSANESKVWLALLRDTSKGDKAEINWLLDTLIDVSKILARSIITLRQKKD